MENDQLKYFASLTPEELLRNHKILSLAAFGLEKDPGVDHFQYKIKFDKEEWTFFMMLIDWSFKNY